MSQVYSPYLGRYVPYMGSLTVYTFKVTDAVTGAPVANAQCAIQDVPLGYRTLEGAGGYTDSNGVCAVDVLFAARYYGVYKAGYVTARGSVPGTQINVAMTPTAVQYWVAIIAGVGGSVNPSGTYQVAANTKLTVTATPQTGYILDYWLVNNVKSGNTNPLGVTIDKDNYSIYAVFKVAGVPPPNGGGMIKTVTVLSNKQIAVPLLWNGNSHTEPINFKWDSTKTTIIKATLSARAYSDTDAMQMDFYLNAMKVGDVSWPTLQSNQWKETIIDVTGRLANGNNSFKFDYYFTWWSGRGANAWIYADLIIEYTGDEPTSGVGDWWAWLPKLEWWQWGLIGGGGILVTWAVLSSKGYAPSPTIIVTQPYEYIKERLEKRRKEEEEYGGGE